MPTLLRRIFLLIVFAAAAGPAGAVSITTLASDTEFLATYPATEWTKEFGANVRWGNNAANGDWEASVVNGADLPLNQRQGSVAGSRTFNFSYTGGTATLSVQGLAASTAAINPTTSINTVMIRARAGTNHSSSLTGLTLQIGATTINLGSLIGDANANYLVLKDAGFAGDWSISAIGTLLAGANPRGSDPMYQLKVGHTPIAVPDTAATVLLLALSLALLTGGRAFARATR